MKTQMLTVMATLSVAVGALAQGSFSLGNGSGSEGSLAVDSPGNWFSGTFGMEVWELNGTSIPAGINLSVASGSGALGYNAMVAAGFFREKTFANQTVILPGVFQLGEVDMPDVLVTGGITPVVVALAVWNTSAPSWSAMLANANQATRAGIVAFVQPTGDLGLANPLTPPNLAMNQDLVLSAIPEPSGLALAGLGTVLLLLLRRRR